MDSKLSGQQVSSRPIRMPGGSDSVRLRVLMVEDSNVDADIEAAVLHEAGYDVDACQVQTESDFMFELDRCKPDVILVDNRLPHFDGPSAIRLARRNCPAVPVLVVTGSLDDTEAARMMSLGACDYLLKERLSRLGAAVKSAVSTAELKADHQRTARNLRLANEQLEAIVGRAPLAVVVCDAAAKILLWNPEAEVLSGWTAPEAIGRYVMDFPFPDVEQVRALLARARLGEVVHGAEFSFCRKDGQVIDCVVSFAPVAGADGGLELMVALCSDVTAAKRTARGLERTDRALRTLSACNQALVHASSEDELLQATCRVVVEVGGFQQAHIAYVRDDAGVEIDVRAGWPGQCAADIVAAGPAGAAITTGQVQVIADARDGNEGQPWKGYALRQRFGTVFALPLRCGGRCVGVMCICSAEVLQVSDDEVKFLEDMAADLAFGIASLRDRAAREHDARRLHDGMVATIQAMATTLEMRDAYTAGHQRRVAALARRIALKLGYGEDFADGVFLAALVHDLGKIQVPAEILSKPTRLSPIELELVKTHSKAGYDILKDIDFAWPIAEIVYQHHERLDGSGYPRALKGDAILPQARILAVADTVEAMATHRPYRPARGQEAALRVILDSRGQQYDAAVVDACVSLFHMDGYRLED